MMHNMEHRPHGVVTAPFGGLINEFFGRDISHLMGGDELHSSTPRVNIVERKDSFKLDLIAPGFGKDELKLNVEENLLTISGEKKQETLQEGERWTRREFARNAFKRSFSLPKQTDLEGISAEHNNGVLTVIVPKVAESKPASVTIPIV